MTAVTKQQIIAGLFKHGILVTPTILQQIENGTTLQEILTLQNKTTPQQTQTIAQTLPKGTYLPLDQHNRAPLHTTFNYDDDPRPFGVQDFVSMFNKRFEAIGKILRTHSELDGVTSIRRLKDVPKEQRKNVSIIGCIYSMRNSKNGHLILELEDKTGKVNVLVNKDRPDIFSIGQQLVLDDMVGIVGAMDEISNDIVFANNIILPDIPHMELKKTPFPVKAAFTSDLHFGSKYFFHEAFNDFISWINGDTSTGKEKEEIMQIKYLFLVGDLVEGVGIYPGQEKDLEIQDVEQQYTELAKILKKIRKDIHIIACGGNHDAMRIAEPQPVFYKKYCQALYDMENFTAVSSPSMVTIAKTPEFSGIDILLYHGFSFPYYFDGVDFLRQAGGINRIDLVMEFLLKRRHLAPTHTSTQYVPDGRDDFLVIKKVPDFFVSGHIHKVVNRNYKNVTMLNCSAWFGESDYMIKRGIIAEPAKVLVANMQTREVTIKDFDRRKK